MQKLVSALIRCTMLMVIITSFFGCSSESSTATHSDWYVSNLTILDASQTTTFFDAGQLYFNVQSTAAGTGEIRGEVTPLAATYRLDNGDPFAPNPANNPLTFSTILGGEPVRPRNVVTQATGYGSITLNPLTKQINGFIITEGIVGTTANLHDGLPGTTGASVLPLEGGPVVWNIPVNTTLTDPQIAQLSAGAFYFNVTSPTFPDGEIRGQLDQQVRSASLKGSNVVTPVVSSASGVGFLAMKKSAKQFSGFVKVASPNSPVTSVTLLFGPAGTNGVAIAPLVNRGNGFWALPTNTILGDQQVTSFDSGELYINVRTAANPTGELRGQFLQPEIKIGTAILSGTKEIPPVSTLGSGTGMLALNTVTGQMSGNLKTDKVAGTLALIHSGATTVNGSSLAAMTAASPVTVTPTPGISFALDIQPIFNARCAAQICHVAGAASPTGVPPMSLEPGLAYASTVSRVTPGNSATSYFVSRLTGAFPPQMPLGSQPLSTSSLDLIKGWIDAGALDN